MPWSTSVPHGMENKVELVLSPSPCTFCKWAATMRLENRTCNRSGMNLQIFNCGSIISNGTPLNIGLQFSSSSRNLKVRYRVSGITYRCFISILDDEKWMTESTKSMSLTWRLPSLHSVLRVVYVKFTKPTLRLKPLDSHRLARSCRDHR